MIVLRHLPAVLALPFMAAVVVPCATLLRAEEYDIALPAPRALGAALAPWAPS